MKIISRNYLAKYITLSIILTTLSIILYGCAATTPNISIVDEKFRFKGQTDKNLIAAKAILAEISSKNELLAIELGKLPEIQDGVSMKEKCALEDIINSYNKHRDTFDKVFGEMYKVGIAKVRKYCSPLQALFWLSYENQTQDIKKLLENYSLPQLLNVAWKFEKENVITSEQVLSVINEIKDEELKKEYLDRLKRDGQSQVEKYIFFDYKKEPSWFTRKGRKIINEMRNLPLPKWADFDEVTDRLNAPELLDYYIDHNLHYHRTYLGISPYLPKTTFSRKWGDCDDLAAFGMYVLKKGGYKVFGRVVFYGVDKEHTGAGIKLEDGSYFLVIDFTRNGNDMSGPYDDISEVDDKLSNGLIHTRKWWPPFYK